MKLKDMLKINMPDFSKILVSVLGIALLFGASSCANYKASSSSESVPTGENHRKQTDLDQSYEEQVLSDRLIIYTAYIALTVKDLDEKQQQLQTFLKQHNAYIESSSTNSWTIRVPQLSFDPLLAQIETLGAMKSKNLYSQDVTDQYRDTEIRLETLEKSRQRYLELLNKAEKVSEVLEIERELERINVQIESMKGQLKRLDSQVQYATITVNLQEKVKPGPLGYIGVGLYKVVKWLFVWG